MMMIAVTLCNIFIIINSKKINFLYILLFILSTLVIFFNYSTTFFICYTISFIVIAIFLNKKLSIKFWIFSFIFLILNSIIFFGDSNCSKKITDINVKNIVEKKIGKGDESMGKKFGSFPGKRNNSSEYKNLTTLIYERSAILTLDTFRYYPLGWGFDGMDNATNKLINKDRYSSKEIFIGDGLTRIFNLKNEVYGIGSDNFIVSLDVVDKSQLILDSSKDYSLGVQQKRGPEKDYILSLDESNKLKRITFKTPPKKGDIIYVIKDIYIFAKILNLNDGLSNFFKILNEFGIFSNYNEYMNVEVFINGDSRYLLGQTGDSILLESNTMTNFSESFFFDIDDNKEYSVIQFVAYSSGWLFNSNFDLDGNSDNSNILTLYFYSNNGSLYFYKDSFYYH